MKLEVKDTGSYVQIDFQKKTGFLCNFLRFNSHLKK